MPIIGLLSGASAKGYGGLGASLVQLPTTGFISIQSTTVSGTAANVTFSSIPATYKHLQIRAVARTDGTGVSQPMFMRFNGATTTYHNQGFISNQTGLNFVPYNGFDSGIYMQRAAAATASASYFGSSIINIIDYATSKHKTCVAEVGGSMAGGSSSNFSVGPYGGTWQDTAAITSIVITPQSGSWVTNTVFSLYGIF